MLVFAIIPLAAKLIQVPTTLSKHHQPRILTGINRARFSGEHCSPPFRVLTHEHQGLPRVTTSIVKSCPSHAGYRAATEQYLLAKEVQKALGSPSDAMGGIK